MAKLFVNVPNIRFLEVSMQQLMDKSKDYATAIIDYINYTDRTSKMKKVVFESAPQIDRKQSSTLMHIAKKYNSSGFCKKGWKFEYDFELKTHNLIFSKIEKELVDEKKDQFIEVVDEKKEQFIEVDPVDFEESPSISEEENPGCFKLLLKRISACISTERTSEYEVVTDMSDVEDEPLAIGKTEIEQRRISLFDDSEEYASILKKMVYHDLATVNYHNLFVAKLTKRLVIPTFVITVAAGVIFLILYYLTELSETAAKNMFSVLILLSGIGSLFGILGTLEWGKIANHLEVFRSEIETEKRTLYSLKEERQILRNKTQKLYFEVSKKTRMTEGLEKTLEKFTIMKNELQKVAGIHQDLLFILDCINLQCSDLEGICMENEKAHLMSIYYEMGLRDGGVSRMEYQRFLSRLSERTRKEFELNGGFDAMDLDGNGLVDVDELGQMLHKMFGSTHKEFVIA
eukprot:303771_1